MQYRSEIDGLRALAVIPVILFHAGFGAFAGGFVGVDVFFVISGYLITSIIVGELDTGSFSIARFYERRTRRILPALMVVALCSLPFGWFLLPAQDAKDFAQSLVAMLVFLSNFLFWREDGYFSAVAEFKPFLHSWSLAVEEQFYVFYPLLLMGLWKFARKAVFPVLVACLLISLAAAQWIAMSGPTEGFFLSPLRAWELVIGCLCALILRKWTPSGKGAGAQVLGLAGIAMIVAAVLLFTADTPNPAYPMLLPTMGTAFIILFAHRGGWASRVLSLRPMVWIGLISYSAYLWHYPLLVFYRHYLATGSNLELERSVHIDTMPALLLCLASLVLAWLTYRTVEQPCRSRAMSLRRILAGIAMACLVIVASAAAILGTDWQQKAFLTYGLRADAAAVHRHMSFADEFGASYMDDRLDNGDCVFSSRSLNAAVMVRMSACREKYGPAVAILGDSHAMNLHNVAYHIASDELFRVTIASPGCRVTASSCNLAALAENLLQGDQPLANRVLFHEAGSRYILDQEGRSDSQSAFIHPETSQQDAAAIGAIFERLQRLETIYQGAGIFLGPFYEPRINIGRGQHLVTGSEPRPTIVDQFRVLDDVMARQASASGVQYVSLQDDGLIFSNSIISGDCLIYRDTDHLTLCGERRMADAMQESGHPLVAILRDETR